MGITIKKKNIKWIILVIALIIVLAAIIGTSIQKSINEEREARELQEFVDKTIEREYKDLIREYERYKEILEDYDYSYDYRCRCISKINKLVGRRVLNEYDMNIYSTTDQEIREELRSVARINARNKVLGIDY